MSIYDHFSVPEREVLRKRAERAARPIEARQPDDLLSVLRVAIANEWYAIPTLLISGVYENAVCVPVPCVPPFIVGITNIRGHILTVLDLATFFNVNHDQLPANRTLVVIARDDVRVALAVSAAGITETLAASRFLPIPENMTLTHNGSLTGLLPDGTALLNIDFVMSESLQHIDRGGS